MLRRQKRSFPRFAACIILLSASRVSHPQDKQSTARMQVPAAGLHPRVLFTAEEIPAIRVAAKTKVGEQLLWQVKWQCDYPGKDLLAKAQKGEKVDADSLLDQAFYAAMVWLVAEDIAYLDKAKEFLTLWSAKMGPPPVAPVAAEPWRSLPRLALCYDLLFSELSPEVKSVMRGHMAMHLDGETNANYWRRCAYAMGPSISGRGCDWGAITSGGLVMAYLAIEGEDPEVTRRSLDEAVKMLKWIADYSLTPEGVTPNNNGYAGLDFAEFGIALRALERRGVLLIDHPNVKEMPTWLAYETVPGCYLFDNRNQASASLGLSNLMLALAARNGGVAAWLQEQALGPERRVATDPVAAASGLIYGSFPDQPAPLPPLPLSRWSSSMGTVYSRSGWRLGDSCFTITMEPPGQHHTHPDKGSFTFYSHGQIFAADAGVSNFNPADHNTVLIDGNGQAGGQGATDAVVRAHLASELADLTLMDIKPAYESYVSYTETAGQARWDQLLYRKGLPLIWKPHYAVHHFDRYALFVRALPHPYVVIVDDVQKDEAPHRYQWLLHSLPPGQVEESKATFKSRFGGTYLQSETGKNWAAFKTTVPAEGEYTLWVLARPWPDLKSSHWFCIAKVNAQWSAPFYMGHYCNDWQWCAVSPGGNSGEKLWKLKAGEAVVEISMKRGGRIAQVVLSRDPQFQPQFALSASSAEQLPLQPDPTKLQPDWSLSTEPDPQPQMDVHFLRPGVDGLKLQCATKPLPLPRQCLTAEQNTVRAGYSALLLPYEQIEPAPELRTTAPGQAVLKRGQVTDYLAANPVGEKLSGGDLTTDAKFALVRVSGDKTLGYLLVGGTFLKLRSQELATSSRGPVHLVNDGKVCCLRAPQGAVVRARQLSAAKAVCNYKPAKFQTEGKWMKLSAPVLKKQWQIAFSPDETVVTVEGDGPLPLKIKAPKAIKCIVNGVSVWFSRAPGGCIYPKLDVTVLSHGEDPPAS